MAAEISAPASASSHASSRYWPSKVREMLSFWFARCFAARSSASSGAAAALTTSARSASWPGVMCGAASANAFSISAARSSSRGGDRLADDRRMRQADVAGLPGRCGRRHPVNERPAEVDPFGRPRVRLTGQVPQVRQRRVRPVAGVLAGAVDALQQPAGGELTLTHRRQHFGQRFGGQQPDMSVVIAAASSASSAWACAAFSANPSSTMCSIIPENLQLSKLSTGSSGAKFAHRRPRAHHPAMTFERQARLPRRP